MRLCVISIFCTLLQQVCVQNPRNQWTLLPNVVIVEVTGSSGQLPLTCLNHTGVEDDDINSISWMKDGVAEDETIRGNSYLVQLDESQGGGNYTCHGKDGSLLNHTVVLIQEDEELEERKILQKTGQDYLDCSAQNYNGEFQCSWLWDEYRSGKITFVRVERGYDGMDRTQCSVDPSGQRWTCSSPAGDVVCTVDSSGHTGSLSCLDKQHCSYAEETQRVFLSIYVTSNLFLVEEYNQSFYLSKIVKPGRVTISRVNSTTIEWVYPSSWSSPYSYFPLSFQVAEVRRGCSRNCSNPSCLRPPMTTDMRQFKVKRRDVCVRAQDVLCNSQWSEWSHYRPARGKRKHKRKDQQNRGQVSQ